MSSGIIEAGAGSMSGSIIAYILLKLWKKIKRQIKVRGLLINDANTWNQLEQFSNEEILFINIKKELGSEYPDGLSKADIRLKVYPKAKVYINNLKEQFKKKTFIVMSDDIELLNHISIKNKYIKAILPSVQLIDTLQKNNPLIDYNKIKLEVLSNLDKQNIHIIDNNNDLISRVRDLYNVLIK